MQRSAIILACFFICTVSTAQQYPYVHYTPKDGLVNSRVKKAYQDSKGRMYFLTYGGLSVYDGARFRNYTTQNGLPMNIVNDIIEIGNDSLLVATNSNNINLLANGRMEAFRPDNKLSTLINQFYRHDDGRIYLSSDFGLFCLEKNKIHELNISGLKDKDDQPNLGNISGSGNYLVITINEMNYNKGIYLYDIKNNRICDSLKNTNTFFIGKDRKNRIWISSAHKLLIVDSVSLRKGKLLLFPPDKGYRPAENYSTFNVAFGKDQAWFVYRNTDYRNIELHRINEEGNMIRVNLPLQTKASYITSVFLDRENNIWLCNDGEGVFKIVRSQMQIIEKPFDESVESQAGYVYYNKGITWYSTISKKLFRKTGANMEIFTSNLGWSPYIFFHDGKKILANDAHIIYQAIIQNAGGSINFQKIITLPENDFFGKKILVDPNGVILASLKTGLGVWLNNKLISHIPIDHMEHIEDLFIDINNRLWVVKRSLGIDVYNFNPADFSNYLKLAFHIPPEQLAGSIRSFVTDKKGLIWLGTRNHGLATYRLKENKLEKLFHFQITNGLSDNFVTSLACDSMNNILAGTQSGLDLVQFNSGQTFRVENLSRNGNLFAYINMTWADTTHGYALTNSGVVLKVNPTTMERPESSPTLLLEELKVNAKTTLSQQSRFNYNENNIGILVAAPSFIDEKQIRYTYLLQGSGNDRWSDTTAANSIINLTNLSSGKYVLKVKAFFHSDAYSPSELSYSFEITAPWWQTWWFRTIAGIFILTFFIIGFRFYYRRKLEKQLAVLEKQQAIEKERTRIATDMHDDLGAGLSRIKFLSETIGLKKQQQQSFEEDISKIREYSHEMIDKMGEIVWALNEKNDSLSDLLSYTRSYAMEYLSQHGINCIVDAPEQFPVNFVSGEFRRNVYLTVKEALHNVVKHAQASEVIIKIKTNKKLEFSIQDNGTGFDKNIRRVYSNGLINMEKRIKELGGQFGVENKKGSNIKFTIPLQE